MRWPRWRWGRIRRVVCPDGSERFVYINIDDVLPLYLGNEKDRYEASVKVLNDINARLSGQHEETINQLLFKLDEKNMSAQQQLRAAYLVYGAAPCEKLRYLEEEAAEIATKERESRAVDSRIRQIQALIATHQTGNRHRLATDPQIIEEFLRRALDLLTRPTPIDGLMSKMRAVEENAKAWSA